MVGRKSRSGGVWPIPPPPPKPLKAQEKERVSARRVWHQYDALVGYPPSRPRWHPAGAPATPGGKLPRPVGLPVMTPGLWTMRAVMSPVSDAFVPLAPKMSLGFLTAKPGL